MGLHKHYGQIVPKVARVRATLSASASVPNNTVTTVNWTSEAYDTDGLHSTSTNPSRITFNRAGAWLVVAQLTYSATTAAATRDALMYLNTSEVARNTVFSNGTAGIAPVYVSAIIQAIAGDYVEVKAWQGTGAALSIEAAFSYLSAAYLGE